MTDLMYDSVLFATGIKRNENQFYGERKDRNERDDFYYYNNKVIYGNGKYTGWKHEGLEIYYSYSDERIVCKGKIPFEVARKVCEVSPFRECEFAEKKGYRTKVFREDQIVGEGEFAECRIGGIDDSICRFIQLITELELYNNPQKWTPEELANRKKEMLATTYRRMLARANINITLDDWIMMHDAKDIAESRKSDNPLDDRITELLDEYDSIANPFGDVGKIAPTGDWAEDVVLNCGQSRDYHSEMRVFDKKSGIGLDFRRSIFSLRGKTSTYEDYSEFLRYEIGGYETQIGCGDKTFHQYTIRCDGTQKGINAVYTPELIYDITEGLVRNRNGLELKWIPATDEHKKMLIAELEEVNARARGVRGKIQKRSEPVLSEPVLEVQCEQSVRAKLPCR